MAFSPSPGPMSGPAPAMAPMAMPTPLSTPNAYGMEPGLPEALERGEAPDAE